MDADRLSLSELNARIRQSIQSSFPENIWVVAEISEIHTNSSGHCYLELIEKDQISDRLIAKMRATIWSSTFRMLKPYFEKTTSYDLVAGLKVMVKVSVEFHELYGISLNVKDIDPNYTIGDLARKKQEIIARLMSEGVFDMNRELAMPLVPQRIAVISSKTAAGFGDFIDTLEKNASGFKFSLTFYGAIMQGNLADSSIITAFEKIYENVTSFDAVVLIRGGGSQSDLECFNSYDLAYIITQFPIPVITGIGHERDISIADMVAHTRLKTPTAVASFLVDGMLSFLERLQNLENSFTNQTLNLLTKAKNNLQGFQKILSLLTKSEITEQNKYLHTTAKLTRSLSMQFIKKNSDHLIQIFRFTEVHTKNIIYSFRKENIQQEKSLIARSLRYISDRSEKLKEWTNTTNHLDPRQIMKRGFSISTLNGHAIKDSTELNEGDLITSTFYNGSAQSKISRIDKPNNLENG